MARYGGIPTTTPDQCNCVDCRWGRAIPSSEGLSVSSRERYLAHNEPSLLTFENWKESVDQHLMETAGYNLEHASTIVTNMYVVLKTQFENRSSTEEVAQKIISVVEQYQ